MTERGVEELRARLLANDRRIVGAVNERLRLVEELWRLKAELGLEQVDPRREQELLHELSLENPGPLSAAGLERLIGEVLDLTKRELR